MHDGICISENTDIAEYGRRNAMAKKRLEKAYQVITLEELCGILFGAESGEKCLLMRWVENTKYKTTHGRGGAGTLGGRAFPQKEQIEIFLTEEVLCQVWSDSDRSTLWRDFNDGYGKNYLSEIVLARPKENKVNEARRELSKWFRDDYDGSRMRSFSGHFREMLEDIRWQNDNGYEGDSGRGMKDASGTERLSEALIDLLDRECVFEEKNSALEESDPAKLDDKKKNERVREKKMRENRAEMRNKWRTQQYGEWRQMAACSDAEKLPELLLRMVLYAVLTVERAGDIEEICSALPENDLKEEIYNNVIEKRKIKGDEFSGMSERINEVTATYASRSDSLSEDIIRLVKESREVCGIGVALSELTGMGMVLTKILAEGTKFRLLLSDPEGEGRRLRELEETGCEDGHIVKSVNQAIENMKILRDFTEDDSDQIRIRYYREIPRASLIFFDDRCALIQFYLGAKRGKETPAFMVRNEPGDRIFGFYKKIFEEMWERAEGREETFEEEDI